MKNTAHNKVIPLIPRHIQGEPYITPQPQKKSKKDEKAVQVLFKTLSQNNYRMHESIDRKAKIVVSINAIVLSVLVGTSFAQTVVSTNGTAHLTILLIATIISTVFALMSIKPFLVKPSQLGMKENNLLNFVAITKMDINQYKTKLKKVIKKDSRIYEAMTEDIFFIGKNIKKKYTYLAWSGMIFLGGLIISGIIMSFTMN